MVVLKADTVSFVLRRCLPHLRGTAPPRAEVALAGDEPGVEPSTRLELSGPLSRKRFTFSSQAL